MSEADRRRAERHAESLPIRLSVTAPSVLQGQTVNLSTTGVLVTADGKFPVILEIKGRRYAGELVRATPVDSQAMAYAIQLTETLDTGSLPGI